MVTVQWLDEAGNTQPLLPVPGNYLSPTRSPDGSRLALTSAGDIWVYELRRGSMTTRSYDPAPDGKSIVALIRAETPREPSGHVVFLLNFFDELRRRAPFGSN